MPYSTGSSDDSGYSCVRTNGFYSKNDSCFFYDLATSSITCSDEEDECTLGFQSYSPANSGGCSIKIASRSNKAKKARRNKSARFVTYLPRPSSTPNSISSCSSDPDSLDDDARFFHTSDSVLHLYMYFQSLLLNIRRQQRFFEQIARVVGDGDARWGAHGHKNGWKFEPSGCYAPLAYGDRSKPTFFAGCWAVPHPVVYLSLLGNYIKEYLMFLKRNYPIPGRSVQRYAGDDHGMLSTATYRSAKNGRGDLPNVSSDDVVPTLMKFMQQQSSTVEHDEENGLSKLNSWPAVGPRAGDESSENTSPTLPVSPLKQNYSAVVARSSRSSTTDVPKDSPMLYSKKAATNLHPSTSVEEKDALLEKPPGSSSPQTVSDSHSPKDNRVGSVLPVLAATAAAVASSKRHESTLNAPPRTQPPSPPPTTPVDTQGQFEVSKMDVLSEQIWHYHNSVTQTEAMLTRKLHLRDMLYYAISPIFPMCGLYVVGSSLNGFGNNSSDMDLCLMITNKDLDQKTDAVVVLNMILTTLSKLDWVANQHLILAKVPILRIKFSAPWQDITVDLNANNSVAIKNTHLLCYYSSFDWRIRPLVSAVKEWAKRKGINDANRSSFTSYSLVLMVIHYLQCGAEPAVLPSLQRLYPKRFHARVDVRTLNVTQPLQHPSEDWLYQDKATLGELLIGFLDYYANKFDYNRDAISVREGKRVERAVMARHRPSGVPSTNHWRSQWRCICIEEPFTLSNTAHSIYDEMVFDAIKNAFREAHDELERNRDLNALLDCKPISVSLPHNGAVVYACDNSAATTDSSNVPSPELLCSSSNSSLNTAMTRSSSSVDSASSEEQKESQPDRSRRKRQGQQTRKPSTSSTTVVTPQ